MSGETIKVRETRRLAILAHNAVTNVLNDLKEEDYPFVHTSMGRVFTEDIVSSYYKYIDHFKMVYSDMPDRKLTAFDKALLFAMALEHHPVVSVGGYKGKKPARLTDLKEKAIANAVVDFLHASNYSVKGSLMEGTFDVRVFEDGHKKELKQLKTLLAKEFKTVNFDYNACLAILVKLYSRGIIYQSGFDTDLEVKIAENLRVKDNVDAHGVQVSANNTYQEFRKRCRR